MKFNFLAWVVGTPLFILLLFFKLYVFSQKILCFEKQQETRKRKKKLRSAQSNNFICLLKHIRANSPFSNLEASKTRKEIKPLSAHTAQLHGTAVRTESAARPGAGTRRPRSASG